LKNKKTKAPEPN